MKKNFRQGGPLDKNGNGIEDRLEMTAVEHDLGQLDHDGDGRPELAEPGLQADHMDRDMDAPKRGRKFSYPKMTPFNTR